MKNINRFGLLLLVGGLLLTSIVGCNVTEVPPANDPTTGDSTTTTTETTTTTTTTTTTGETTTTADGFTVPTYGGSSYGKLILPTTAYETTTTTSQQFGSSSDGLDLNSLPEPTPSNTDWFVEAGYGIMVHCTEHTHNNGVAGDFFSDGKKTSWDECVNGVDVNKFAQQVVESGAGYVVLCVQQQYQFFATPIAHFENLLGAQPGETCSTRDLPLDMMNALAAYDIPFILYFTGDGCWRNNIAFSMLSEKSFPNAIPNTEWNDKYVENWSKMILELSLRYGKKLAGWFFDGMDRTKFTDDDLYWFAKAAKAGNPDSILAFNGATWNGATWYTPYEDYCFGEQYGYTYTPTDRYIYSKDGQYRSQWHMMAYLDGDQSGQMHTAEETITYIETIMAKQGVVTFDVDMNRYGEIRPEHLEALREVKAAIRD